MQTTIDFFLLFSLSLSLLLVDFISMYTSYSSYVFTSFFLCGLWKYLAFIFSDDINEIEID
jgi:hypothetical protein